MVAQIASSAGFTNGPKVSNTLSIVPKSPGYSFAVPHWLDTLVLSMRPIIEDPPTPPSPA